MSSFVNPLAETTQWSTVEKSFLQHSGKKDFYPGEHVPIVEVQNVYELGRIVALSFLEWVLEHPQGVVALPTGKTPEFFIRTMDRYREHWQSDEVQEELRVNNFPSREKFPDTTQLKFVMLDEFFPMLPTHRNSFVHYVRMFYLSTLGIAKKNVLDFDLLAHDVLTTEEWNLFEDVDVDLSLLQDDENNKTRVLSDDDARRQTALRKVRVFCDEFEARVQRWGGIGFFLGGIGPDGHIAFNQEGAAHDSVTRLVSFNYPTAAAAAGDLGGIERARGKAAMTIGLRTITASPAAKIVIIAAGEGKASVIRQAVESSATTDPQVPATALHGHAGVRFYVTHGAALSLSARQAERVRDVPASMRDFALTAVLAGHRAECPGVPAYLVPVPAQYAVLESALYSLSLLLKVPVHALAPVVHAMRREETAEKHHHKEEEKEKKRGESLSLKTSSESERSLTALTPVKSSAQSIVRSLPAWLCDDNAQSLDVLCAAASRRLREKIEGGLSESALCDQRVLHTAPHHDDIMLSYHAAMHTMLGRQRAGEVASEGDVWVSEQREREETMHSPKALKKTLSVASMAKVALHNAAAMGPAPGSTTSRQRTNSFAFNAAVLLGERFNNNMNHFAYLTSGFHSVNDDFLCEKCDAVLAPVTPSHNAPIQDGSSSAQWLFVHEAVAQGELTRDYDDLLSEFRAAFIAHNAAAQEYIENVIFLRKVAEVWSVPLTESVRTLQKELVERVVWIRDAYLAVHLPGDAIPKEMQLLKGCIRESEVDRVWALSKMPNNRVHHLRSKFYTDDFFTPMPSLEDDALPMANLLRAKQPNVVTVAFDPEGTGPDTHYKVLQVVAAGLRVALNRGDLDEDPLVWGYRNVWFVFAPSQATLFIPSSAADLDLMHDTFMACFSTQKSASFPSPLYDGPFSAWARDIQRGQREMLGTLLGEEFFTNHADQRVRESAGFVLIDAMPASLFLQEVEELKSKFENI